MRRLLAAACVTAALSAPVAHGTDALDSYRALGHGDRARVLALARGAIGRAMIPEIGRAHV